MNFCSSSSYVIGFFGDPFEGKSFSAYVFPSVVFTVSEPVSAVPVFSDPGISTTDTLCAAASTSGSLKSDFHASR